MMDEERMNELLRYCVVALAIAVVSCLWIGVVALVYQGVCALTGVC